MNKSKLATIIKFTRHVSNKRPKSLSSSPAIQINALKACSYSVSSSDITTSTSNSRTGTDDNHVGPTQEYGTKIIIQATPFPHDPSHRLSPFLAHNLQHPLLHDVAVSSNTGGDVVVADYTGTTDRNDLFYDQQQLQQQQQQQRHQNFTVTFLGTGAGGRASNKRAPSCTALRLSGCTFLFDAGEGTQRQLAMTQNLGVMDIVKIFVTHMHADHIGGLMGVILQKEMGVKHDVVVSEVENDSNTSDGSGGTSGSTTTSPKHTLEIYGPKGIYDYIAMNLAMTGSRIRNLKLVIYELVGGSDVRRAKRQRNASSYQPSSIVGSIAPNINMEQRTIEMGNDGTWTIQTLAVMKEHDVNGRDVHLRVGIKAAEVLHLPGIQTFGYVVEECTPSAKIDAEKAKQLGIAPGLKYRALKNGYSVMSDDGLSEVTPAQVMVDGVGKKRARKFALLGDAWKVPKPMMDLCCGADLLVHEATLEENLHAVTKQRGHSTADMAGRLAMQVKAKILAMNHISGRHDSQDSINELVQSAEKANCKTSDILVAHDFLMVSIPEQYEDNRKGDKQPTGEGQVDVHSL